MALSNIAEVVHTSSNNAATTADVTALAANPERNGCSISFDSATATDRLFIKLGATATATNFDYALAPDQSWPGLVGAVVWQGAVHVISATTTGRWSATEV